MLYQPVVTDRESGVSDVIGSILLISVVVISIAVISVMVLSNGTPEKIPAVEAVISNLDRTIFIYHNGGDLVNHNEITILVNGKEQNFSNNGLSDWKTWSVGESLIYTAPGTDAITDVKVLYTSGSAGGVLSGAQFGPGGMPTQVPVTYPPVPPVASFTGIPTTQYIGLAVTFTDTSSYTPTTWFWDFGDGTSSTVQNPTHTYTSVGTYTVNLTATNAEGSSSARRTNYITIINLPSPPVANFNGTPVMGSAPLLVTFTDMSTNSPTSWSWTFGDGTTSSVQNTTHTYTAIGTYTVNLTASNAGGNNTVTKTSYITVGTMVPGWRARYYADETWSQLAFTNTPPAIHFANNIALTNYSYLSTDIANWPQPYLGSYEYYSAEYDSNLYIVTPGTYTFQMMSDDGSYLTIDGAVVNDNGGLHPPTWSNKSVYLSTGYHPINVKMYNHAEAAVIYLYYSSSGMPQTLVTNVSRYTSVPNLPVSSFVGTPVSGIGPLNVQFTESSTGNPAYWSWSFGDGDITNSAQQNPLHTYTSAGTYTVTLTTCNDRGDNSLTRTNYITVTPPAPVASFTGTPSSGTKPLTVSFTDTSTYSPTSWLWTFGDGTTSTARNPTHTYTASGTYSVTLKATNVVGSNTVTRNNYITVSNPPPTISDVSPDYGPRGWPVDVTLSGTGFESGATVNMTLGSSSINAYNVVRVSATKITCTFDLNGAALDYWAVRVTNPDGKSSGTQDFEVYSDNPYVYSITANYGRRGDTVSITNLAGDNFQPGATVIFSTDKAGNSNVMSLSGVTVVSSTKITGTLIIPGNQAANTYYVRVKNTDDTSGRSSGKLFTVNYW